MKRSSANSRSHTLFGPFDFLVEASTPVVVMGSVPLRDDPSLETESTMDRFRDNVVEKLADNESDADDVVRILGLRGVADKRSCSAANTSRYLEP